MENKIVLVSISEESLKELITEAVEDGLNKKLKPKEKELLTTKEVLELLNISPGTLYNWKLQGIIPYKSIGRRVFYERKAVLNSLNDDPYNSKIKNVQ